MDVSTKRRMKFGCNRNKQLHGAFIETYLECKQILEGRLGPKAPRNCEENELTT
jgi:hypothetical protein